MNSYTLRMISLCSCLRSVLRLFQVIPDISRSNGVSSRIRYLSQSLDVFIGVLTRISSHSRNPGKARRHLVAATKFKGRNKAYSAESSLHSVEWRCSIQHFHGQCHWKWRVNNLWSNNIIRPNGCVIQMNCPQAS